MRHGRIGLALSLSLVSAYAAVTAAQPPKPLGALTQPRSPEEPAAEEPTADEARDKAVAERFRRVLETNPRRGTALDRLYGYHVERGTLDQLVGEYAGRTKKNPKDGTAWMIVGLLESQRGRDAAAVAAFKQAEANLPTNALPAYYLGQSLVLVGQPDAAAEAFERAITRKPNRADLLDVFQALGRVYQRAQKTEQALGVWNRLEALFPDDSRVQEQIATTLVEEGQFAQALPRLEKLAGQTEDKYRQSSLRMDAAELKVKLKKTAEALNDFEKLLSELNPESWLYRDVRRRVEEVFLRGDDLAGLAKYYERWLEKNPTDVDAIARLAKTLATQGRAPEARKWLEKGIAVAPSNRGLRQALVDQFVFEQNFAAAAQQYEALDKADPNNPDTLREWGKLILRDTARPEADRRAAAAAVWKRMLDKKPNDPVTAAQVADLMRTANLTDDAIALYKKAIALAPDAAQYREYLGEYYHSLKRPEDALATWRPIADGPNRTSKNLTRLAEVFAGFGYRKEAITALADAIALEKDDFTLLMTYANLLHEEGRHDEVLQQIDLAGKLTSNPEEVEQVLLAQIKVFQATDKLGEKIEELKQDLDAGRDATADRWLRLARYYEANRQLDEATEAVVKAGEKDPKSVPAQIAAARIYESAGNLLAAADANRKLAALDRRFRTEYLTAVAKLEQRLGRRDQAMQAGRDLLAASPGNPEVYKFFADLCFQLGDQDEGLEALRRSVRANPSDPQGLITLANALGERLRQGEAIELLWRAFEKTNELDGKLGVVERITQLYLENNQFDRLLERLERERRESDKAREMTMCVAQAYTTAGDLGTARSQLERLLTENNRDTHLLGQLVALCEQEGDYAAAVKFQRQLNAAAPQSYDNQLKLAQLLTRTGDADEAADIWVKLVANETEPHRNLSAIDSLLTATKYDAALAILSRMLARKPGNWELLYREGAALEAKGKRAEAAGRFQALLGQKLSDDELSEITKYQIKQAKKKASQPPKPGQPTVYNPYSRYDDLTSPPLTRRTGNVYQLRRALSMDPDYSYGSIQPFYAPSDFGEARMAALGWLYESARAEDKADAFAAQLKAKANVSGVVGKGQSPPVATGGLSSPPHHPTTSPPDPRPLWDWFYLQTLRQETKSLLSTALTLSKGSDPAGLLAYLNTLNSRGNNPNRVRRAGAEPKDTTPPLPADQLAHALACYRKLQQTKPDWVTSAVSQAVMTELKRAKREAEEAAIYQDLVKTANTVAKVQTALSVAANRNDLETCLDLFTRLERLQPPVKSASALGQLPSRQQWSNLLTVMGKRAGEKKFADVRKVLDFYLAAVRRQNLAAPRSAASRRRTQTSATTGMSVRLYTGTPYYRAAQISYPSANDYYDDGAISLLYNAFDMHKKADLTSDLFAHLRGQLDVAQGAERLYLQLAAGYLHWWAEEKDEALAQLTHAVESAPGDHNLLLEVAALRELNGEHDAALALLDSVTPLDTQMMQRREEAALRLAERTGNLDRARQAADRLFGLRLDPDKQLELAGKMHRLGLHDAAETVLNRAQRQAGNKTATLVRLMTQYQSQNQTDLAVQIARQILRKGPSTPSTQYRGRSDDGDPARNQAIGVLARSGQLKEMIERAEAQLKASPRSVQLYQALIAYYQAAGDKAKMKAAVLKTVELKPDDGKLRFQAAQQLLQAGDRPAAMDQYKAAIKLDPSQLSNRFYEIMELFAQANRMQELAQLMDEIDLRKVGQYYYVMQPIGRLLQDNQTKDLGLKLFKKAWEAYPQYRGYMLGNLYGEDIWRLPEIYTYAKQAVIPREDSEADPWQSAEAIMSYGQEGRVDGVLTRLMSIARKQQRLPELRAEVAAALAKRPDWVGGKAVLAVIDVQSGHKDAGRREWQEAFSDPKADVPPLARFILCQELEFYAGVEDLAIKTMEDGFDEMVRDGSYQFSYNPARRLVWWYDQLGRKDDARRALNRVAKSEQVDPGYSGGYWQYQQVSNGIAIAQEMAKTGDPVEAVRIYNRLLADKETLDQANQYSGGERFDKQLENGLKSALKALKPDTLPTAVAGLLTPREGVPPGGAVLDLVVMVESRDLSKAALNCVFASAIKSAEKAPEVRKDALARLAELTAKHPADLSVHTAAALAALADGSPDGIREAVDRLVKLVESTPLEPLPANGKPNARQRAEALPQVPLWLVARECLRKDREPFWQAGEVLAERAAAAARRQQNPLYAQAILREWAQADLDRGDRAKAEARLAEVLALTLPKPNSPKPAARAPAPAAPPAAPAPAPATPPRSGGPRAKAGSGAMPTALRGHGSASHAHAKPWAWQPTGHPTGPSRPSAVRRQTVTITTTAIRPPATVAPGGGTPTLTTEQFHRAYELARLAAEQNMPDLSLRAMREAVRGGPPVVPTNRNRGGGGRLTMRVINGVQYYVEETGEGHVNVDHALVQLAPKWKALGVPPAAVYEVLAAAVLPPGRPAEVFLYGDAPVFGTVYVQSGGVWTQTNDPIEGESQDGGLIRLLADVAVEAGKVDDLRARTEARAGQPLGELPARLLLATLALQTKDDARAAEQFKALGERLRKDSQQTTNERVVTVVVPAFNDPKFAPALAPIVEKAAENFATSNSQQKAMDLRFKLAEYHLARKDEAAARAQFKAVEGLGTRVGRGEFDVHLPLARQYLKAGWADDALRELGLHADHVTAEGADPRRRQRRAEPALEEMPQLVRLLLDLPPDRRYRALKDWSLPTAARKSVRYFVGLTPKQVPPPLILPPVSHRGLTMPLHAAVSTLQLLAEAAKACGKADELIAEADRLAAEKVDNAEVLRVLAHVAGGRGAKAEPVVAAYADAARKRLTAKPERPPQTRYYYDDYENYQPPPFHPSELIVATLCLADPALAGHGESLLGPMLARAQGQEGTYAPIVQAVQDRFTAARAGARAAAAGGEPPRWHGGGAGSVWFAQDGYAVQAADDQLLFFDTPLTGTFEFSVDAYGGGVGYAGVVFSPVGQRVSQVGGTDQVTRPGTGLRPGEFNRLTVQVAPGRVRYLFNGRLYYEDTDPPPTSPWVTLGGVMGGRAVFRNFALSGTPAVPAEVRLTAGDDLGGWRPHLYQAVLPPRLSPKEPKTDTDQWGNPVENEEAKDKVYAWQCKGGEIQGRRLDRAGDRPAPSALAYFRPLRPGEAVRYEFFYEPGRTHVHPSLGRLAFLLEPGGVKLHWLTDPGTQSPPPDDWTGLPVANAVDDPAGRRGAVNLKAGDWNAVTLSTTADGVSVALNGTTVYEAKLDPAGERLFGLFHYKDRTAARVRNVVLTGPWPKAVGTPEELALTAKPPTPAAAIARRRMLGERHYATEAADVVARARSLPPAERYRALAAWVLPTDSRPLFQLAGVTRPQDVLGVVDQKQQPDGRRVMLGGRLESPCLELVAAAKEAGTLDALAERVTKADAAEGDELFRRSRLAVLAGVRAAQGRDAEATDLLQQLRAAAEKVRPDAPGPERWPDLVAVLAVINRPALVPAAVALAQATNRVLDQALGQNRTIEDRELWMRLCRDVRARAVLAQAGEAESPFAHWDAVPGLTADSRGQGWDRPRWVYRDGTVTHHPGHAEDYLILRTPLRGDFEVTCGLKVAQWRDAYVRYGAHEFVLNFDRRKYRFHTSVRNGGRDVLIVPPLPPAADATYQFKLAVKDGWLRASVDGRELAAERIGPAPEPWLMLHAPHNHVGELKDVRITGTPTVPAAIDLLASDDLGLWRPYLGAINTGEDTRYYGPNQYDTAWKKRGEELYAHGKKPDPPEPGRPVPPRAFPETAVYYQRPMAEDGAVDYEFYYDPDKAHVHPMLDRLVFLLEPDGVKLHWLTDGPHETSGVAFDNVTEEPSCRRGPSRPPLRAKAWNRVQLAVAGDTVKVSLNGTPVYERPIEPTNQRLFGLFHYTDRTEARVRSMTYAGDWPKQLPPNDRLFEKKN